MKPALRPLFNQILIQREGVGEEVKTPGGLFVPQKATEKYTQDECQPAKVLAVGDGKWADSQAGLCRVPLSVKTGDRVLVPPFGGHAVKLPGFEKGTVVINEEDIVAVLER